eukprot:UN32809
MLVYTVVGTLVYCFCVGGGMFSYIRNTPWAGGSLRDPEYINPTSRNQHTVEGYLMGFANFVAGVGIFLYVNSNKAIVRRDNKQNSLEILATYFPTVVSILLFFGGWYTILNVYNIKSPHYRMGFVGMTG